MMGVPGTGGKHMEDQAPRWQPVGDQPMRMATVRIGVDASPA